MKLISMGFNSLILECLYYWKILSSNFSRSIVPKKKGNYYSGLSIQNQLFGIRVASVPIDMSSKHTTHCLEESLSVFIFSSASIVDMLAPVDLKACDSRKARAPSEAVSLSVDCIVLGCTIIGINNHSIQLSTFLCTFCYFLYHYGMNI